MSNLKNWIRASMWSAATLGVLGLTLSLAAPSNAGCVSDTKCNNGCGPSGTGCSGGCSKVNGKDCNSCTCKKVSGKCQCA